MNVLTQAFLWTASRATVYIHIYIHTVAYVAYIKIITRTNQVASVLSLIQQGSLIHVSFFFSSRLPLIQPAPAYLLLSVRYFIDHFQSLYLQKISVEESDSCKRTSRLVFMPYKNVMPIITDDAGGYAKGKMPHREISQ